MAQQPQQIQQGPRFFNNQQPKLNFLDAKKLPIDQAMLLKDPGYSESIFSFFKDYIFSRYSSPDRIIIHTFTTTVAGTFFGLAQSIFKDLPKRSTCFRFMCSSFGIGLSYFTLNEMINGMVRRTIGKEQFWISNSISAAITMLLFYGVQVQFRKMPSHAAMQMSSKYLMTLCVGSLLFEIFIISQRDKYLNRQNSHFQFYIERNPPKAKISEANKDQQLPQQQNKTESTNANTSIASKQVKEEQMQEAIKKQ